MDGAEVYAESVSTGIAASASMPKERIKKRKLKREALRPCSRQKLELKTGGEEEEEEKAAVIREREEGPRDVLQSTWNEMKNEDALYNLPGIPLAPTGQNMKRKIIFVLERASLVPAIVGRSYQILQSSKHADFLRRKHMDPYCYRPDIVHEALLEIIGSRLCAAGRVDAIYVKTDKGVVIKVEPHARIPESLGRFCAMISELLQKFSIKAKGKREKLLSVVANPVTKHLPVDSLKIGLSFSSQKALPLEDYVATVRDDVNLVFVVGAMAHGKIESDYTDDLISVSKYPLSAEICLQRICNALESKWKAW